MMTLDSALVILMAEALAALLVLALALFFVNRRKRNHEISAIDQFISELDEKNAQTNHPLLHLADKIQGLDKKALQAALQDVGDCERALMQKVIELFLKREMGLLGDIDQCIGNLSEPYCKLLTHMTTHANTPGAAPAPSSNTHALERINQQLVRQLDTAMQTIDEITSEYTRVFSGNQTELELENSSKKMLQILQASTLSLKHEIKE